MSHLSPAVSLVWAISSVTLGSFLVFHLWSFDRFKCLKWNHGPHPSTFKRVMTYSYLLSVPLFIVFSIGFTVLTYAHGFTDLPTRGIVPTPPELWSKAAQSAVFPLFLCFSIAWGFEIVTHLEELCFWLFFVHPSAAQQDWFRSPYFKTWAVGSCTSVVAMPLITTFTRADLNKCEASTFLAGGLVSLLMTFAFLPVLWVFPSFIHNLRQSDVESRTLARLIRYHELNCIRVLFRFLSTISFVILGADGVRAHPDVDDKMFPDDLLGILAAAGCVVSSGITLVIFFPRSIEAEMEGRHRRHGARPQKWGRKTTTEECSGRAHWANGEVVSYMSITQAKAAALRPPVSACASKEEEEFRSEPRHELPTYEVAMARGEDDGTVAGKDANGTRTGTEKGESDEVTTPESLSLQPNRWNNRTGDVELGGVLSESETALRRAEPRPWSRHWSLNRDRDCRHHRAWRRSERGQGWWGWGQGQGRDRGEGWPGRNVSEVVHHWRSPIDVGRPTVARWQRRF